MGRGPILNTGYRTIGRELDGEIAQVLAIVVVSVLSEVEEPDCREDLIVRRDERSRPRSSGLFANQNRIRQWAEWAELPIDETLVAEVQEILAPIHNWFYIEGRPENNDPQSTAS